MKKTFFVTAIVLCLVASVGFAAGVPTDVTIKAAAAKQPAVNFPHAKHVATVKTCDTCHHTDKGLTAAKAAEVKPCMSCHLDPKNGEPSAREMSMTKNPFHMMCVKCHKAETEKKGPTVCKDCHKK
ncbi:MAG: cytochrome c3 family protein [Thermoanaerobaculia bacterium]